MAAVKNCICCNFWNEINKTRRVGEREIDKAGGEKFEKDFRKITGIRILDMHCRGDICQGLIEIVEERVSDVDKPGPDP